VEQTEPIIEYRIRVLTTGLIVSWLGLAVFGIWGFTESALPGPTLIALLAVSAVGLVILTFAPWRTMMRSGIADWVLLAWSLIALSAIEVFELTTTTRPSGIAFILITFFAAATLMASPALVLVGVATVAGYTVALLDHGGLDGLGLAVNLLAFVGAVVFVLLLSLGIRTQLASTSAAYEEMVEREKMLTKREREMSQLYDISRTIGAGSKLDEVLPELIGRVAMSVEAKVGIVLLYDPETDHLHLQSPIWAAGHTVPADEFSVALSDAGVGPRVFMTGDPVVHNGLTDELRKDPLIVELDAERVAAVAMRVENRTIGVLLVGDKTTPFTDLDIETLQSVAAPAALVLNQMARYEAARSTGERMAELAELKTDFVSVVSHELRTPLTSIIGALKTLQRPELMPEDPRAAQLVDMAAKQSNRLKTLIEDLLVMSRIEADSLPVRPEAIDLGDFLTDLLAGLPGGDTVRFVPIDGLGKVLADPDHLARVVTNLIDNAIKYGGEGGDGIELTTSLARGEVHVSVVDHGPGIPYDQHDRMFERFTQLQPHATRSKGGAGLGLSIVKGLVEAMNGRVWFEPTVGGGATFTVAIPLA
jgi:signal transduction histidine kinase